MKTNLTNKIAVITGASRGIGEHTARLFARAGATVVLLARSEASITEILADIGGDGLALGCDVSDAKQVDDAIASVHAKYGRIDVLVNNAGMIEPISALSDSDPGDWAQAISTNLVGVYNGMRAVVPKMVALGGGTVLTVSSGAAHGPVEGWSAYCASKAGAAMLTRSLDLEERANGIRAMGMSPGTVATQMQREIKASGINRISELDWSDHIPPEWPAEALLWMCGEDADEFLGQEIKLREDDIKRRIGLDL